MSIDLTTAAIQDDLFDSYVQPSKNGQGIEIHPETNLEQWGDAVTRFGNMWRKLGAKREAIQFALGDLYIFGKAKFGETFSQYMDETVIDDKLLTRVLWVCKTIPPESRHTALSFSHHEVFAGVKDAKLREELLSETEAQKLNVVQAAELRKEKVPSKKDTKKKAEKVAKVAKIDIQDEATLLQSGHLIIAYLEAEEAKLPFRKWPAKRLASWNPILSTLTKIARRSVIKTH